MSKASFWCGLRPMTPDGTPIVGPTPLDNLLLATGHGTLGWTMAAGTGRVIADLVAGRKPDIDIEGLTMARYRTPGRGPSSKARGAHAMARMLSENFTLENSCSARPRRAARHRQTRRQLEVLANLKRLAQALVAGAQRARRCCPS